MENLTLWIGGGSTAIALWVLKKIPNDKIYSLDDAQLRWLLDGLDIRKLRKTTRFSYSEFS